MSQLPKHTARHLVQYKERLGTVQDFVDGLALAEKIARARLPYIPKDLHGDYQCRTCCGAAFLLGQPVNVINKKGEHIFTHRPFFVCPGCGGAGLVVPAAEIKNAWHKAGRNMKAQDYLEGL